MLLLDEPTSALDPELVNEVLEVIRRLAVEDGLTMIISTHQLRFADEVADRVVFLAGGAIVEEGPAHEVLTNPNNPLTARFLSVMEADKTPEARAMSTSARLTRVEPERSKRHSHEASSSARFAQRQCTGAISARWSRRR